MLCNYREVKPLKLCNMDSKNLIGVSRDIVWQVYEPLIGGEDCPCKALLEVAYTALREVYHIIEVQEAFVKNG